MKVPLEVPSLLPSMCSFLTCVMGVGLKPSKQTNSCNCNGDRNQDDNTNLLQSTTYRLFIAKFTHNPHYPSPFSNHLISPSPFFITGSHSCVTTSTTLTSTAAPWLSAPCPNRGHRHYMRLLAPPSAVPVLLCERSTVWDCHRATRLEQVFREVLWARQETGVAARSTAITV